MQLEDFSQYTSGCFRGEPASCACACPFGLDVRGFAEKCAKGRWNAAWKAYRTAVVFPTVAAALCPAPCRAHCQRQELGGALDLPGLEKAAIRFAKGKKNDGYNIPPKTQTVAVVGAGVAGLAAALQMALKKYAVTVFDRQPGWGGSLRAHPRFAEFEADFQLQFSAVKPGFLQFVFQREILCPEELADFDVVYLATGAGGESWEGERLYHGGELLGCSKMEAIAMSIPAAKAMESFLMTGRKEPIQAAPHSEHCGRYLPHPGVEAAPPQTCETEEGAKAEAERCLQCDCSACLDGCEMLRSYRKLPHGIAREAYADSAAAPPIATQSLVRQTYSCTNCGNCQAACPGQANLGALFMLSRSDRFRRGTGPKAFHDFWLREMDFASGEAAAALPPKGQTSCKLAFFPGCRLGMDNPEQVAAAYRFLNESTPGGAGLLLGCCGVPALWAGDMERLEANREKLLADWEALGKPALVFACATCERTFAEQIPQIPRVSLYTKMAEAGLKPQEAAFPQAAVFDPCAARADSEMRMAVRGLAERAGASLSELADPFHCCGFGGHIRIPNPKLYEEIAQSRAAQSELPYLVYCANCREVFRERGKDCAHILDLYFGGGGKPVPTILEKRSNALRLKRALLREEWDMDFTPSVRPWESLEISLSGELQAKLERCFISLNDVRETIWRAEHGGEKLISADGQSLACLIQEAVTYWVQYQAEGEDRYSVSAAYSHRMKWRGTI